MPNRDGFEATRYLRDRGYDLPIYALTAETGKKEINRALEAGCNGFLGKPLNNALLYNALSEQMMRKMGSQDEPFKGESVEARKGKF